MHDFFQPRGQQPAWTIVVWRLALCPSITLCRGYYLTDAYGLKIAFHICHARPAPYARGRMRPRITSFQLLGQPSLVDQSATWLGIRREMSTTRRML